MAVIKRVQPIPKVVPKIDKLKAPVQSVRQPSKMEEMGDVAFGTLDPTKDGQIVSYDSTLKKFVLITADDLLSVASEDGDVPDNLVRTLEGEINLGQLQGDLDGGEF